MEKEKMKKAENDAETRIDCSPDAAVDQCCKAATENKKEKNIFLSPQFFVWYFLVGSCYVYIFYLCYWRSNEWANRLRYTLRPGIVPGRRVDATDAQWRQLRELFLPLFIIAFIWVLLSNVVRKAFGTKSIARKVFYVASILGVLFGLHSKALVFPIFVSVVHYMIAKVFRTSRIGIFVAWVWNIGITLFMYDTSGFRTIDLFDWFFDNGQMLRWHTIFKISLLRMISFHMDYYWALKKRPPNQRVSVKYKFLILYIIHNNYLIIYIINNVIIFRPILN